MPYAQLRIVVIAVAITFLPAIGRAYPVQGLGATSCAEFAKMYQSNPKTIEDIYFAWAQGFMSGMNMGLMANKQEPRELAGETRDQAQIIRTFCADNPLKTYMDAVLQLWTTLKPFRQRSN